MMEEMLETNLFIQQGRRSTLKAGITNKGHTLYTAIVVPRFYGADMDLVRIGLESADFRVNKFRLFSWSPLYKRTSNGWEIEANTGDFDEFSQRIISSGIVNHDYKTRLQEIILEKRGIAVQREIIDKLFRSIEQDLLNVHNIALESLGETAKLRGYSVPVLLRRPGFSYTG